MQIRAILRGFGFLALLLAVALLVPFGVALGTQGPDAKAFGWTILLTVAVGGGLIASGKGKELGVRDGFAIVTGGWLLFALLGSLPYLFSGTVSSYTDAFFEAMSGFTTTGATILPDIETAPLGILLWRSLTQWLGGMGIIVLSIALLPLFGVGGLQLFRAETPGPTKERLVPRIRETAKLLWGVYVALSALEWLLLALGGMPPFEALLHTFTTMSTGGFSPKNASIAAYASPYLQWVIVVFMALAGTSFSLHYFAINGNPKAYWKNREFRLYFFVILLAAAVGVGSLLAAGARDIGATIRDAIFQAVSITTTTGFVTADFEVWPIFLQTVLLFLMFFGGCSGSTGGGMKHIRLYFLFRQGGTQIARLVHPRAVKELVMGGRPVSGDVIQGVQAFFFLYLTAWMVGALGLAALGMDLVSGLSAAASALGNIGPALGAVGPTDHFGELHFLAKWLLTGLMLLGRLEIFPVLAVLTRGFWRQ